MPIEIQMGEEHEIEEGGHTEMVEVQYILDPSGEFHVGEEIQESKIVIDPIGTEEKCVVEIDHSQIHVMTSEHSEEHLATVDEHQDEVITGIVVEDGIIGMHINDMISADSSMEKIEFKHESVEQDNNSMSSEGQSEDRVEKELYRKCFLCQIKGKLSSFKDLFSEEIKKMMLPQLLNRYMSISIVPKVRFYLQCVFL